MNMTNIIDDIPIEKKTPKAREKRHQITIVKTVWGSYFTFLVREKRERERTLFANKTIIFLDHEHEFECSKNTLEERGEN